jgi:hypothetical protein
MTTNKVCLYSRLLLGTLLTNRLIIEKSVQLLYSDEREEQKSRPEDPASRVEEKGEGRYETQAIIVRVLSVHV